MPDACVCCAQAAVRGRVVLRSGALVTPNTDLQLERAEFEQPDERSGCAICSAALDRRYYQVNGKSVCPTCRGRLEASLEGGSRLKRGVLAMVAGVAAAAVGSILYYAILALTGYEFALIAIVVGLLVGKAVSWGAEGRGGWLYQTMAIVLTYLSIVSAYVPLFIAEVRKVNAVEQSQVSHETTDPTARETPAVSVSDQTNEKSEAAVPPAKISLGRALLALALIVAFICAAPFLGGLNNIIGIVIIGIGLYEAWKLNRRRQFVITGPHTIVPAVRSAAPAR